MRDRGRAEVMVATLFGAVLLGAVAMEWVLLNSARTAGTLGDLAIYREAIQYAATGGSLYDYVYEHPTVHGMGFTYPPFAVLVLSPLTWFPLGLTEGGWIVATFLVATSLACLVVSRAVEGGTWLGAAPPQARVVGASLVSATLLVLTFPFLHNLAVGQLSLVIVALCLVDGSGLVPRRWRGALTGVAAAVKLTPLIFIPYFLLTRQWRAAAWSAGTFAVATGLGFILLPRESITYWGSKVFQTSRVGALDSPINKSILGTLSPMGPPWHDRNVLVVGYRCDGCCGGSLASEAAQWRWPPHGRDADRWVPGHVAVAHFVAASSIVGGSRRHLAAASTAHKCDCGRHGYYCGLPRVLLLHGSARPRGCDSLGLGNPLADGRADLHSRASRRRWEMGLWFALWRAWKPENVAISLRSTHPT